LDANSSCEATQTGLTTESPGPFIRDTRVMRVMRVVRGAGMRTKRDLFARVIRFIRVIRSFVGVIRVMSLTKRSPCWPKA
jgi:hypothetical protein